MSNNTELTPRRQLADVTRDIRFKTGQFLLDAIDIGHLLYEAKSMVEPGGWMEYVEKEVPFSQSWANNYMRLYKEYGGEQQSLFGNSQAPANLSPTQALELLALPTEEREEFMQSHDVENMSTRELKQAIRERDEAVNAKKSAEAQVDDQRRRAEVAEEEAEHLQAKLENAAKETAAAEKTVEDLKKQLAKSKENEKVAKAALKNAKENPELPEEVMEQLRQQVAADTAQAATAELQKQLQAAQAEAGKKAEAQAAAEKRLEEMQKELQAANPALISLGVFLQAVQDNYDKMYGLLLELKEEDPEMATKLAANASEKVFSKMVQQLGEM